VHPQIVITESTQPDPAKIRHWLHRAMSCTDTDANDARALIRDLVREYQTGAADASFPVAALKVKAALA
jgi:hypothetical protein